ncbi:MAG: polyprenyl synthetase family protein [Rhodospirillaceae bacterium]|nr:polyprenyl synthetase family protein [Rhodospirillaceae bacterium]
MAVIVPLEGERRSAAKPSLDAINRLIADDLEQVNAFILRRMESSVPLIPQIAGHIVSGGGKRIRPILTLATARLCGYGGKRHLALAACIEFIHTATLLHDDVVDQSRLRRGRDTANSLWGNKPSVLVGDFLFSRAFQMMVEDGSLPVLAVLSRASARIAEGEVQQLMTANDLSTSETTYLEVVKGKTAVLFAAACQVGAIVADQSRGAEEAMECYGLNLGIAFQLADDAIDYASTSKAMGKAKGDDFRDGKITLPVILAYRRGTEAERDFWRRTLEKQEQKDGDLDHAIGLLNRHRAIEDTVERARHYGAIARDALGLFPDNAAKHALLETIDFTIERAF